MEDITLGLFTKTRSSHARLNVPALVQVAAFAIILIRGLDLLMILNLLGLQGLNEFIHRSVQTEPDAGLPRQPGAGVYRDLVRLLAGERAQLGALDLSADADYRCRLPVGGVAGLRVSGAVQHSRGIKTRDFPLAGDAKTAGSAGSDAAVRAGELPSLFRLQ